MTDENLVALPYLVQRVALTHEYKKTGKPSSKTGVDGYFTFEYMGSSEFEWGALPDSLKEMRQLTLKNVKSLKRISPEPTLIKALGHEAWYVGRPSTHINADVFFADQLQPRALRRGRLKEASFLHFAYGVEETATLGRDTIGWWALDPCWCLFKEKEHAEAWLKCL